MSGADYRSYTAWGRMSRLGRAVVFVTLLLLVSTVLVGTCALRFYRYESGTPTTATVVRCEGGPKSRACYGTWNIGGRSQTGLIRVRLARMDHRSMFVLVTASLMRDRPY
jgi:hypothetical protein